MKPIVRERLADEVYQQLREHIFQNNHTADRSIDIEKIAEQRFQIGQAQEHGAVLIRVILAGSIGPLRFAERIHWTWRGLLQPEHVRTSLIVSGALFLLFGLGFGLDNRLSFGLGRELSFGLINGLGGGPGYWGYWDSIRA